MLSLLKIAYTICPFIFKIFTRFNEYSLPGGISNTITRIRIENKCTYLSQKRSQEIN